MKLKNLRLFLITIPILCSCIYFLPFVIPLPSLPEQTKDIETNAGFFDLSEDSFIYYEFLFEKENKKTLVFVHGFGGSSKDWELQRVFFFDKGYNVVTLDLLGFGRSSKNYEDDYTHKQQAKRICDLLSVLNISKATFVGHSMGGNVIAHIGHDFPEKVEKLIFVAPAIVTEENQSILLSMISIPSLQRYFELFVTNFMSKDRIREILKTAVFYHNKLSEGTIENFYKPLTFSGWSRGLLGIVRDSGQNFVDIQKVLATNDSYFIWGLQDRWIKLEDDKNQWLTSGQSLLTIKNSGHLPMIENVEEFNDILIGILTDQGL